MFCKPQMLNGLYQLSMSSPLAWPTTVLASFPATGFSWSLHFSAIYVAVRHSHKSFHCITRQICASLSQWITQVKTLNLGKWNMSVNIHLHTEWYVAWFTTCKEGQTSAWLFICRFTGDEDFQELFTKTSLSFPSSNPTALNKVQHIQVMMQ